MAKFIYYRFHDHPELENNTTAAVELYKSQFQENDEKRIKFILDSSGISVYEDEINLPIKTRVKKDYNFTLQEPISHEFLKGYRNQERYSYFKINASNYLGNNQNIMVSSNLENGEKFKESIITNNGWDNHQRYISYIISGLKQRCTELEIANLNFDIIDLEYNLFTSCHTSFYAAKLFIDELIKPNLIKKASA